MYDRQQQLPPFPPPWCSWPAKQPGKRTLRISNDGTAAAERWDRVEVAVPTLLVPYRDDNVTGTVASGADFGSLAIDYSPENPGDGGPILRGGQRGEILLHSPGEWWVRVMASAAVGGSPQIAGKKLPVLQIPVPSSEYVEGALFSRLRASSRAVAFEVTATAGRNLQLLAVQDMLDGALAIDVQRIDAGVLADDVEIVWSPSNNGSESGLWLEPGKVLRYEGPSLLLCDLYAGFRGGGGTVRAVVYY